MQLRSASSKLPFTLGALALLVTTASAQWPTGEGPEPSIQPCLSYWPENDIDWSGLPATHGEASAFGRTILGDWDGDFATDAALIAGTRACAMYRPDGYDWVSPIETTAGGPLTSPADIATLPGGGVWRADGILATSAAGLEHFYMDGADWESTLIDTGPWVNAAPMHVDDLDNDGLDDVYALSGPNVIWCFNSASGFGSTYTVALPTSPSDVLAIDWNGNGSMDFALLADSGLQARTMDGLVLHDEPFSGTYDGAIARINLPAAPTPGDYIVWARYDSASGNPPELLMMRDSVTISIGYLGGVELCESTNQIKPISLHVGNWDSQSNGDLYPDILIHQRKRRECIVLMNTGVAPFFDWTSTSNYEVFDVDDTGLTGLLSAGTPAFGQLDGQGPDDVVFPLRDSGRVTVFTELSYQFSIPAQTLLYSGMIAQDNSEYDPDVSGAGEYLFPIKVPDDYLTTTDYIEVIVWKETSDEQNNPTTAGPSSVADSARLYKLAKVSETSSENRRYQYVTLTLEGGEAWSNPRYWYWIDYRFANYDDTAGMIENAGPFFHGGVTLDTTFNPSGSTPASCGSCFYEHIWDNDNQGLAYGLYEENGIGPPTESGSGDFFGAFVPTSDPTPHTTPIPTPASQVGPEIRAFAYWPF